MSLQTIAEQIDTGLKGRNFNGSLKFDCGEDGVIVLAESTATTQDRETDCTLRLSIDNLRKLLAGKLNPMTAVMMGKIKLSGDMGTALQLAKLLS